MIDFEVFLEFISGRKVFDSMKYIASWSGGKDSTASIILAHENNEPLDLIIFSEVMFDENISGEFPEHIDFIKNKAIPLFESLGYETKILHSDKTYMDIFTHEPVRGKRFGTGMKVGFPATGMCGIQKPCKLKPIKNFLKELGSDYIEYVGIAKDEPKRLERLCEAKISLLEKYGYTEQMAFDLCKKYDLISPIYNFTHRGGCWFCPNMRDCQLRHLRNNHRDLWDKLLELENMPNLIGWRWNSLTQTSIHDKEEQFMWEDRQMNIFDYIEESEVV